MKPNKEKTTHIYYEWICIKTHFTYIFAGNSEIFTEGQSYWFHEDCDPESNFLQVVDDNDLPIQKRVRV
jgi:hypothetical protein